MTSIRSSRHLFRSGPMRFWLVPTRSSTAGASTLLRSRRVTQFRRSTKSASTSEVGGLMSYGTVFRDGYHRGGIYVGRLLKGVKPAELPVEQINKLELVFNGKTAKALGLEI